MAINYSILQKHMKRKYNLVIAMNLYEVALTLKICKIKLSIYLLN